MNKLSRAFSFLAIIAGSFGLFANDPFMLQYCILAAIISVSYAILATIKDKAKVEPSNEEVEVEA